MNYQRNINLISGFVSIVGLVVMLGWIFDVSVLKSILPVWPTMKFATALCFFMSGLSLIFIGQMFQRKTDAAQLVLSATSFIILLFMLTFLISTIVGIHTGIEDLFIKERVGTVLTTPGRPSIGTMICFILVGISGLLVIANQEISLNLLPKIGWVIASIGVLAILGYVLNVPLMYYAAENLNTAMALHTAILFVMLGIGLIFTTRIR